MGKNRRILCALVAGTALLALSGVAGAPPSGGITAPGFMRLRLFNGSTQTRITNVVGRVRQNGLLPQTLTMSASSLDSNERVENTEAIIGSVDWVQITFSVNGVGAQITSLPFNFNAGDYIGDFYVIVRDWSPTVALVETHYPLLDNGSWTWQTVGPYTVNSFGGCAAPGAVAPVAFQSDYVYNGHSATIPAANYQLRFHSTNGAWIDPPSADNGIGAGDRWQGQPYNPNVSDVDLASMTLLNPTVNFPVLGVTDSNRQLFSAQFFVSTDGAGNPTVTSHSIVHRTDTPPYWFFK